ncbi:CDP-diacylglycerol--glycerol-3-phosphate 3-phosphatidyltransferase [Verrucomicrobia bacterium LW23]|nr:CDP-diacylglycerol--glycerol-3-phosphate 3-phosphatidyltransferase [Verrucomicrobia bacterium LW23]
MRNLNLANQLTLARLVMCALFVASMSLPWAYSGVTALALFVLASLTDWLDGEIARRYNLVTDLGKLLDPLADKVLISAALIALIERSMAPMWMVVAIITREFLVTGLRTVAANKQIILPAERAGKYKTVAQIVAICASLTVLALRDLHLAESALAQGLAWIIPALYWVALLITVVSGGLYFYKNRGLFDADAPEAETSAAQQVTPDVGASPIATPAPVPAQRKAAASASAHKVAGKAGLSTSA